MLVNKGLAMISTALGGVTSTITGIFVSPDGYVDEISTNPSADYMYKEQATDLSKVAVTRQVHGKPTHSNGTTSVKLNDSLNKHYFGQWRVLSEGWGDDLYLIDHDDKFQKISSTGHANDFKNLWAGRRLTDGEYYWFGPRLFPFDKPESSEARSLSSLQGTLKLLKRQDRSELQQLSSFLQGKEDGALCEIIDIVTTCEIFKRKLINSGEPMNKGLKFQLEKLSDHLEEVSFENQAPSERDIKGLVGIFADVLKVEKFKMFQRSVATNGVKWLKKIWDAKGKSEAIENPFEYWYKKVVNDEFGYECNDKKLGEEGGEKFFGECRGASESSLRITHVLKAASDCCRADKQYGVSIKDGEGGWNNQEKLGRTERIAEAFSKKLVSTGIVDENCENLKIETFIWRIDGAASKFCHEINKLFFEDTVNGKRYCRYEINNARGYLRTYRLNLFTIPTWVKGKAFWAKCHANGD